MANITAQMVKELRESTGAGMMDCKKALVECDGDVAKATEYLQIKGLAKAAKRGARKTSEGYIGMYLHHDGKKAIMVEVNCETDFVARTDGFRDFCKELAIHICGCAPLVVAREDLDPNLLESQKHIITEQALEENRNSKKPKPEKIIEENIIPGRLDKWLKEITLLDQHWMGDDHDVTVEQKRAELSSSTGENIRIRRFARIAIGEGVADEPEAEQE
ncbi:MAG: translation elongation factor Ts [Bradymonadia bacterium]